MLTFGSATSIQQGADQADVAFVTSSLLCGAAPSTPYLVAARGLQAVGAAMVVSNMAAIMTRIFPPEQQQALGTKRRPSTLKNDDGFGAPWRWTSRAVSAGARCSTSSPVQAGPLFRRLASST